MQFERAFYIKLGTGGQWAADCIEAGKLRLGWSGTPLDEIHRGDWDNIRSRLAAEHINKGYGNGGSRTSPRYCDVDCRRCLDHIPSIQALVGSLSTRQNRRRLGIQVQARSRALVG